MKSKCKDRNEIAFFGRLVVDIRELFAAMPSEQKADLDGEFLIAIAEQP